MFQPERTRVSRWARLRSFAVGKYKAVELSIERRFVERKPERIARDGSIYAPSFRSSHKLALGPWFCNSLAMCYRPLFCVASVFD